MSYSLFHFFIIFLLFALQSLHCQAKDLQSISIDTLQTFPLSYPAAIEFQISKTSSSVLGTFQVSVISITPESASTVILVRQGCRDGLPVHDTSYESRFPNQDQFGIFFDGDSSEDNCFGLRLIDDVTPGVKNFTLKVTFTPFLGDVVLKLDESHEFNIEEKEQKPFAFYSKGQKTDVIQITAKPTSNSTTVSNLEFSAANADCKTSSSMSSWLCFLRRPEDILKFTVLNPSEAGQYAIKISPIQPEQTIYNYQGIDTHLIPGFGALYMIELPAVGILKVMAKGSDGTYLPITAASSLRWLFSDTMLQSSSDVLLPNDHIHTNHVTNESYVLIKNSFAYTSWYIFIQEENAELIEIYSYFMKQDLVEVDIDAQYYIDPEIYEYQHIELKLGAKDFITKYEVTLRASQKSLMNIYYSTDLYYNTSFVFPDSNFNIKQASIGPVKDHELVLPLFIVAHDTSVYLTVHGLTKGFYTLSVREIQYPNIQQGILIVILISCISAVIYLFFALIYNLRKSTEFYDFEQTAFPREDHQPTNHTEVDLEANLPQIPVEEVTEVPTRSRRRNLSPQIATVIKILKRKVRAEMKAKMMESQRQGQDKTIDSDSTQDKSDLTEDNMCDICYERKKTIMFGPCGHACSCDYCAIKIIKTAPKCPLCRAPIEEIRLNEVSSEVSDKQEVVVENSV